MERDAHQAFVPDTGASAAASGEASSSTGGRSGRTTSSLVWNYFHRDAASATTATCRSCGKRMRAKTRDGTSSLWRHIQSRRCVAARADEPQPRRQVAALLRPPAAAEPSTTGDQGHISVAEEWVVDGIDVPQLYDYLSSEGLEDIDQTYEAGVNNVREPPQAAPPASSSSGPFFLSRTERFAHTGTGSGTR